MGDGNSPARCPDCGDLLQHHYDDGCARCPCRTSHSEASYRLELMNRI